MAVLIIEPEGYSKQALQLYRGLGPVWLKSVPVGKLSQVKLLVVRLGHILDESFLSSYPNLIAIATPTTGLTHIDLNYCNIRNIEVFSLQKCRQLIEGVTSTSELTFGLILSLLRQIPMANHDVVHNGRWERDRFCSRQLSRLTIGIIGLGRIGGHVANYANAFGMRVLSHDPYQDNSRFADHNAKKSDLKTLLSEADIVSIHANLDKDNFKMIGEKEIKLLKRSALVINTSRGGLLDEIAATTAICNGQLGGLAVDVLNDEHAQDSWLNSPVVKAAKDGFNIIMTPHIGGCTVDAMHLTEERLAELIVNDLGSLI